MESDIWDANGAIPLWGPSITEIDARETDVRETGLMQPMVEPVDAGSVRVIEQLSPREREVLQELVDGKSHDAAAQDLFISQHTFRTHVKNILAKLGAHSSIEAVSIAVCAGIRPSRIRALGADGGSPEESDGREHP